MLTWQPGLFPDTSGSQGEDVAWCIVHNIWQQRLHLLSHLHKDNAGQLNKKFEMDKPFKSLAE